MIIIASKPGMLGNRLLIFAHLIACVLDNKTSLSNLSFNEYADWFEGTNCDLFCRFPLKKCIIPYSRHIRKLLYIFIYYLSRIIIRANIHIKYAHVLSLEWDDFCDLGSYKFQSIIKENKNVLLQGWQYRYYDGVSRHADEIREYLMPVKVYRDNVEKFIRTVKKESNLVIGVHIRRGDYKSFHEGQYYYSFAQYAEFIKQVENIFSTYKVLFIICSNEPVDETYFNKYNYCMAPGHPVEDMYVLAKCDYIIGPPSTFTLWSSFYGQVPLCFIDKPEKLITVNDFTRKFYTAT